MKKHAAMILGLLLALQLSAKPAAKYVFYIIGDGMGLNTVAYTQYYKASVAGVPGTLPLNFSQFPVASQITTWSADKPVTDSAASGTAHAGGGKTLNGAIGQDSEGKHFESIACLSRKKGRKIALVTTSPINDATPAAYYGHEPTRKNADLLAREMFLSGFDFFAGAPFKKSKPSEAAALKDFDWKKEAADQGYTVIGSKDEYKGARDSGRIVFIPSVQNPICKAIDRPAHGNYTTLADMLGCAVDFLMKDGCPKGFFIMAEGGLIDSNNHANDAAATVKEVLDLEESVRIALDFYAKHPKETIIIVTADHDTGGPALLLKNYDDPSILQGQKGSIGEISARLRQILKDGIVPSWDEMKAFLGENFGLFTHVKVSRTDEAVLKDIYEKTVAKSKAGSDTDDFGYNDNAVIVARAAAILDRYAGLVWTTKSHSGAFAPFYYLGPCEKVFQGQGDNSSIYGKLIGLSL